MTSITQVSEALVKVLENEAAEVAANSAFIQREVKITGPSFVKALVFGWLGNPEASLSELSMAFANVGVEITRQGVHDRFTPEAAAFLQCMVERSIRQLIQAQPVATKLLKRFSHVYLLDSTQLELPAELTGVWQGSGGFAAGSSSAALKVAVKWDMVTGQLCQVELHHGTTHDAQADIQHEPLPAGSLRVADLAYFDLSVLAQIDQAGAFWLSRYKTGTRLYDRHGQPLALLKCLPRKVGQRLDCPIRLGASAQLPCRLIAERVPPAVAEQRRERLLETARRRQQAIPETAWHLAEWSLYLTNAPQTLLDVSAALLLARYRWQIELLFKLWKDDLQLAHWRSTHPWRVLCEVYAKLIGCILQHWLLLLGCWNQPRRSLWRAARCIRQFAWPLAAALTQPAILHWLLEALQRCMAVARMEPSQLKPRTFQLLEAYAA